MEFIRNMIKIEQEQAKLGKRPAGAAVAWEDRAVHDNLYANYQYTLPWTGIDAELSLFISGSNEYPNNTLIGLKVVPKQAIHTYRAPYLGTPWHISVGFSNDDGSLSNEALAFITKYHKPRRQTLTVQEPRWSAVTDLRADDVLVLDPIVRAFHQSSYYKHKELHITF